MQGYKFSISHRKGKDNVDPDALSRIPFDEIASLTGCEPEIDLNSEHFNDPDYVELINKIEKYASRYPDVRIVDKFVYIRTQPYNGDETQENSCWKLWVPLNLRNSVIRRAHDIPISSHGGIAKTLDLIRRHFF